MTEPLLKESKDEPNEFLALTFTKLFARQKIGFLY